MLLSKLNGLSWFILLAYFHIAFVETFIMYPQMAWLGYLGFRGPMLNYFFAFLFVPVGLKPLFVYLMDLGSPYLTRSHWYLITSVFSGILIFFRATSWSNHVFPAFTICFLYSFFQAFNNMVLSSILVDIAHFNMENAGAIQGAATGARSAGSVAALLVLLPLYTCKNDGLSEGGANESQSEGLLSFKGVFVATSILWVFVGVLVFRYIPAHVHPSFFSCQKKKNLLSSFFSSKGELKEARGETNLKISMEEKNLFIKKKKNKKEEGIHKIKTPEGGEDKKPAELKGSPDHGKHHHIIEISSSSSSALSQNSEFPALFSALLLVGQILLLATSLKAFFKSSIIFFSLIIFLCSVILLGVVVLLYLTTSSTSYYTPDHCMSFEDASKDQEKKMNQQVKKRPSIPFPTGNSGVSHRPGVISSLSMVPLSPSSVNPCSLSHSSSSSASSSSLSSDSILSSSCSSLGVVMGKPEADVSCMTTSFTRQVLAASYLLIRNFTPDAGIQLSFFTYYYFNNQSCQLVMLSLFSSIIKFFACGTYATFANNRPVTLLIPLFTFLSGLVSLLYLPFSLMKPNESCVETHVIGCMPTFWYLLCITGLSSFAAQLSFIPEEVISIQYTSPRFRTLSYSIYLSVLDFGGSLREWITSLIVIALHIDVQSEAAKKDSLFHSSETVNPYKNLYLLVIISIISSVLVSLLAPLMLLPVSATSSLINKQENDQESILEASTSFSGLPQEVSTPPADPGVYTR